MTNLKKKFSKGLLIQIRAHIFSPILYIPFIYCQAKNQQKKKMRYFAG
jgi:hypothetical protein